MAVEIWEGGKVLIAVPVSFPIQTSENYRITKPLRKTWQEGGKVPWILAM